MPRSAAAPTAAGDPSTIGVRCPGDRFVVEVCRRVGPLATTSANSHGDPAATSARSAALMLPDVSLIVDGGTRSGKVSTVVDMSGPLPVVLREGAISLAEIRAALGLPS